MSKEELTKQGYLTPGGLRGKRYGDFEVLELGTTTVATLAQVGLDFTPALTVTYPTKRYQAPRHPDQCRPDAVYAHRIGRQLVPVAVAEWKDRTRLRTEDDKLTAAEQAIVAALAMGVGIAITTDGSRFRYIDVAASAAAEEIVEFKESRDFTPAVLSDLYRGDRAPSFCESVAFVT